MPKTIWLAFVDSDPKTDPIVKVLHAAQIFKAKFNTEPNWVGVSAKFPQSTREQLGERWQVVVCVPGWSPDEIRIGRDDMQEVPHNIKLDQPVTAL
jgi:HSP20 family molecular chaperone IbpA